MRNRSRTRGSAMLPYALLLSGCVLSIEAVATESGAMLDSRLVGSWEQAAGSDRAVVSRGTGTLYTIEYTSDGKTGRFEARLGRLGAHVVLDVWPAPREGELPSPYAEVVVPGHLLLVVEIGADEVRAAALEPDSLLAALHSGRVTLPNQKSGDQLILHGTTEELRAALGPYVARTGALAKQDIWRRARRGNSAAAAGPVAVPCFEAAAWREADQLFHRDPHWVGADVASTVDLGGGRLLWLFGDTWIDPSGRGTRHGARMVSNTLAIQRGADPTTAAISFYWGKAVDGGPAPSFPDRGGESLWPGNGVRVGDRLILFFARTIRNTGTGLGFEHVGWAAVMVENPDDEPPQWRVRPLEAPANPLGVLLGYAAVLSLGEYVYALGSQNPLQSHPIFAARWQVEQFRRGDLLHPEWWAGDRLGWVADSSSAPRWPLFENGQSEPTVHVDPATQRVLAVHTQGFGPADVVMRAAPQLTGPWSSPRVVYRPPEYDRPNVMIYGAMAHPELSGSDLVLTYSTNTFQFAEHLTDSLIYYPRFVRLTRCR